MCSVQREGFRGSPDKRSGDGNIASSASACAGVCRGDSDVGAAVQNALEGAGIHSCRAIAGIRGEDAGAKRCVDRPGPDRHIGRIEQPCAALAVWRAGINIYSSHVKPVAGGFDQAPVAALRATMRRDAAVNSR